MTVLWVIALLYMALWMYSALAPRTPPQEAAPYFAGGFLNRSMSRARRAYVNSGLATLTSFGGLYLVARWSSRGHILSGLFGGAFTAGRAALLGLCLGAGAAVFFSLVGLPFGIYGYCLDRSFNLTPMKLATYLWDYAKNTFLSAVEYSAAGGFVAWAVVRLPRTWHLALTGAFLVASLAVSALYPVLIAPMFNSFHPLPEGDVMRDVRALADSAGMQVEAILVMEASAKTARANAYFSGVGRTKRVVLYDTLLRSHSREEIRLVVAHELAHWRSGHIVKGILISAAGVLAALLVFRAGVVGAAGLRAAQGGRFLGLERFLVLLYVFATLTGFALSPASGYVSRRFEAESDAYSLSLTGDRRAFIASQVNLATTNLADVSPPPFMRWLASTHPSTLERILSASR